MPALSVILPSYNYAPYLDERVRSILSQTFVDFELIVVDDASTDDSVSVLQRFKDSRMSLHVREANSGATYKSWNEGAVLAKGEYLLFAGADDYAERRLFERLLEPLRADRSVGMAHCKPLIIDASGAVTGTAPGLLPLQHFILEQLEHDLQVPPRVYWRWLMLSNFMWNASGLIFRREAFERAGRFDDSLLIAADTFVYLAVAREWSVAYRCEPLNNYRELKTAVSRRLQGAKLMQEVCHCIHSQEPFLEEPIDREFYIQGNRVLDSMFVHYITQHSQAGESEEVEKLIEVAKRYGRQITIGGQPA